MSLALNGLTIIAVCAGAFFFLAGTVGLLRFPDALSRLHALTKADNLGLGLVVLGLLFQMGGVFAALKLISVWLLTLLAAATVSQLLARAARASGRTSNEVTLAFDIVLVLLILGVATWTVSARDTFAAVVGFIGFGLVLALAWVCLAAPDVALTEAAIGSGLTGGLLVGASARLRRTESTSGETPSISLCLCAGVVCTFISAGLAAIVLELPGKAPTLAPQVAANLAVTGLDNPVTAVLMAYRAVDTLLEVVVLLLVLAGMWSLAPDHLLGGSPGRRHPAGPDGVPPFVAQLLVPVGVLVGIHIFWIGSVAPGGEFQGATILAAMWILATMAGLVDTPAVSRHWLRLLLVAGPAVFFAVGFAGFALAGAFLAYPEAHAKLLILIIEIPLTLSIAATLALLVAGPPQRARQQ